MAVMLLEWIFTSVFLILVVLALRAALGKRMSAGLRYVLWAVVLVRLLVPVQLFTSPIAGTWVLIEKHTEHNVYTPTSQPAAPEGPDNALSLGGQDGPAADPGNFPQAPALPAAPDPPEAPDLNNLPGWTDYLGWLWLGGSAAAALILLASNLQFFRKLRRVRVPLDGADCPLPVYIAAWLPSPCLFGLLRPAVYVTPETAADPAMLRHILAHELTHFRHLDHIWNMLRCAALAAHWWNPLVWLAVVLSRRDGEMACDESTLKRLGEEERTAYGHTLLALVTAQPRPMDLFRCATTMVGDKKSLKERIGRIACAPRRILWAAVAAVLVTALACVCAFGSSAEPKDEPEPDPTPAPTESQAAPESPAPDDGPHDTDLNRNGVTEIVYKEPIEDGEREIGQRVTVWENGELIFSDEGYYAHAGYNAVFLCTLDGHDYLLQYNPTMYGGYCGYQYKLFTLEGGQETVVRENTVSFDIDFGGTFHEKFAPDAITNFMDEINGLLANSVQLINTDDDLLFTFEKEGRLYDSLRFLDGFEETFVRDPSKSLLENLRDFQAAMEGQTAQGSNTYRGETGYRAVLLGDADFTLRELPGDGDKLERTANIAEVPGAFWPDDTYTKIWTFAVVDLDQDGTDEVLLYVCGVAGDMGGYLLLYQKDGQVCGTVFNAHNNWSNRWFNNLKADGTFECQGIMDRWQSISKLFFTAGGGTGIYGLTVIRDDLDYNLESFMAIQKEVTWEDWQAALEVQREKPDAVWYDFTPENIEMALS